MTTKEFAALSPPEQARLTTELLGESLPPADLRAYEPRFDKFEAQFGAEDLEFDALEFDPTHGRRS